MNSAPVYKGQLLIKGMDVREMNKQGQLW